MKNLIKPASLLLYLLTIIVFFLGGVIFAVITDAAKHQGLAGGAIVLFHGVIPAFFAFIISLSVTYKVNHNTVVVINKILGIICLVIASYFVYKNITADRKETPVKKEYPTKPTAPAAILFNNISKIVIEPPQQSSETPMGMGFFKPNFYEHPVLYFYGNLNLEKPVYDHPPYDSITFKRNKYDEFEIATDPPWLVPHHLKLDYGILYFKIQGVSRDFIEITVNSKSNRTTYVDRNDGNILYWPEFLLGVFSVEFIPGKEQKVKIKPLDFAGEEITSFHFMRPIVIKGNWMMVELQDGNFKKVGDGWIRWRDNEQLLITYSFLS